MPKFSHPAWGERNPALGFRFWPIWCSLPRMKASVGGWRKVDAETSLGCCSPTSSSQLSFDWTLHVQRPWKPLTGNNTIRTKVVIVIRRRCGDSQEGAGEENGVQPFSLRGMCPSVMTEHTHGSRQGRCSQSAWTPAHHSTKKGPWDLLYLGYFLIYSFLRTWLPLPPFPRGLLSPGDNE